VNEEHQQYMRTSEIGALLGHTNPGSTRTWIRNRRLRAAGRDTDTGEKRYRRSEVLEAMRNQPGQGARTDLRERPAARGPRNDDHGVRRSD
jgi:hypothetical protein